ncbi:MAG: PadR family transcriptional regulator [Microcella sp.]|uniref:PadR family transcriptional regulator n=1 Tax=Microcella sp. TaxID=1913979 RepID=UPI0033157B83
MRSSTNSRFDLWEAMEGLRDSFGPRMEAMMGHTDIRSAILVALLDGAKNGHQVMQAIGARMPGSRTPSAGAVYPMLQQLTDEGLVSSEQHDDRRVYSLTEAGHAVASEAAESMHETGRDDDWQSRIPRFREHSRALPKAGVKLAQAASQVAQSGTVQQQERAATLLDETRRALYAILAED